LDLDRKGSPWAQAWGGRGLGQCEEARFPLRKSGRSFYFFFSLFYVLQCWGWDPGPHVCLITEPRTQSSQRLFFFYLFIIIYCCTGEHCDIYESAYNVSWSDAPPLSFSFVPHTPS
jgi:hypothetical protein